jgi:SUN domain-containing protein 1/2
MSQLGGMGATPARRSARLSQAGSVTNQSVVTTITTGGARQRKKGPLTKVKPRKSNAYGASGRVGAAEELSLSATGFAQAFQNQRGDAVARDDEDEDDDIDELGAETPRMSGALNGRMPPLSPSSELEVSSPVAPGLSFEDSEDITPNEHSLAASVSNTSKSFGPIHEAGMLFRPLRQMSSGPSSEDGHAQPLWQRNRARRLKAQINVQEEEEFEFEVPAVPDRRPKPATLAEKAAIDQSVNDLVAEEQARLQREGPPQPLGKPRKQATPERLNNPERVDEWLGNVEKGHENEHEWTWKRYVVPLFWSLIGLAILSQLSRFTTSDQYPESARKTGMMTAVNARISNAWYDVADWVMPASRSAKEEQSMAEFMEGDGSSDDKYLWSRLKHIYKEFDGRIGDMHDTIAKLNQHLPEYMVVRRHPDGRREVTDDFWNALISKARSPGGDAEWIDYLKSNREKLRDIFGVSVPSGESDVRPEPVSSNEFLRLVQEQYKTMSTQIDTKVYDAIQAQATQIKAIAQAEAKKAIVDSIRLHTLAQSNLVANYELNLRKANYFSPGLGALIEPALTSATFLDNPRMFARYARWLALVPQRNPPKAALDKWEEPGDCWCAAPNPSMNGQAQLTVSLPRPMFPQQVTIEHLPMSMMPAKKITNAPRLIEFWVETDQRAQYQYAHREGVCQAGPAGWTCLGSFTYNIHASNHQQTFDLDAQSSVPVTKAMLRVTSNWGADHTCLYRVRLHGKDAAADHEYGVRLNDPAE